VQSPQAKPKKPVGVAIISAVAFAGGLLSLFGGSSVLSGMATGPFVLAVVVIIFGIFGLALGAGLYTGMGWAWMAGIIIYIVSIGLGVAEIVYGGMVGGIGGIIRIVAGVVIPAYLTRQNVKIFFGKSSPSPGPQT